MIAMSYYPDQVAQPAYAGIVYVFADALKLHFIEHVLIIDRTKKKKTCLNQKRLQMILYCSLDDRICL